MGPQFKKIIFPTDFSAVAASALKTAVAVAAHHKAELHIVTAVNPTMYAYAGYPYYDVTQAMLRSAAKNMARLKLPPKAKGLSVVPKVIEGDIAASLADYATRIHADLIVMASHGRKGVAKFFLGSVATKLMSSAPCPLLVLRAPDGTRKLPVRADRGFTRILVPTDFSDTAYCGFGRALALGQSYGATVYLLHVIDESGLGVLDPKTRKLAIKEMHERALVQLGEWTSWVKSDVKVKPDVVIGDPDEAIAHYAETIKANLVVIGSHGRGELGRMLLGSETDKLIRTLDCPVFVENTKTTKVPVPKS